MYFWWSRFKLYDPSLQPEYCRKHCGFTYHLLYVYYPPISLFFFLCVMIGWCSFHLLTYYMSRKLEGKMFLSSTFFFFCFFFFTGYAFRAWKQEVEQEKLLTVTSCKVLVSFFHTGGALAFAPVSCGISYHGPAVTVAMVSRESSILVNRERRCKRYCWRLECFFLKMSFSYIWSMV